jgi:outer membrane receptor protein involved in Fe transport
MRCFSDRRSRLAKAIQMAVSTSSFAWLASAAYAQSNAPEVIVITPVPGQGLLRQQIAANVQSATAADLARSHAADLASFLNRRLGSVFVNDIQNNPFQPDINFRGFTASPLLGTAQGLSVYMDGVRLNQPFGDVVSWDLIPRSALASLNVMPGSNPLFGLNTLGGALNLQTKDGLTNPGTSVQALAGEFQRQAVEFEHGGSNASGQHWYLTGNRYDEAGWRDDSPSDVRQFFGKWGYKDAKTSINASLGFADNDLNGNGLQEEHLLAADRSSVHTKPDITHNRGVLFNLTGSQQLNEQWTLNGNLYARNIKTSTYNGDINEDSLDQAVYQPNANERAALTAAGYSGFPTAGESAANTPFPQWRCIANQLLNDEPGEKCNGLINLTNTEQDNQGVNVQLASAQDWNGVSNQFVVGVGFDHSDVDFVQSAELGYLNADRSVTGVGAFADGVHAGDIDGEPYDTRVDLAAKTQTWSVFATDTLALTTQTALTVSGRYNYNEVENRDAINPGGGTGSLDGDHEFKRLNLGLGLTHNFSTALNGYVGLNQGSRAPSAIELGCADPDSPCKLPNAMAGDPPLKQVVATTAELGLRSSGNLNWNVGIYRTDSKDDILFVADDAAGFGYFRNFGETRRQGAELGISMQLLEQLTVGANYSFIDATYRSEEVLNGEANSSNEEAEEGMPGVDGEIEVESGHRIPLIPRQQLKLFAQWSALPNLSLNADVTVMAGSYARGNENNQHEPDGTYYLGSGRTAGFAVLNLGADWQPLPQLNVFLQINNVADREYNTAAQLGPLGIAANGAFQARPFPVNAEGERPVQHATFVAPGAPRTSWLGVRYHF